MSNPLAGIGVKRGMDGFDQIAFQERHVLASGEFNNDLESIRCAAVEQYTRSVVCEHTRIGPDKSAHSFNNGIDLGVVGDLKTYPPACGGGINAEIAQRLGSDATVWYDNLHFGVGDQLRQE